MGGVRKCRLEAMDDVSGWLVRDYVARGNGSISVFADGRSVNWQTEVWWREGQAMKRGRAD